MAIKKSELYSSLWAGCDELRGSMDASQYKDYVLVLLFMKYVSDKGGALVEIPKGGSFNDMVKLKGKADIGDKVNKIIGELAKVNDLTGVITVADFNDDEKLGKGKDKVDRLSNLIEIFEKPELDFSSNRAEGDDILGDAYEYLMRHFATESGKSKGQFYTPAEVSRIMAKVIGINPHNTTGQTTVYDPTCGSGSLLLKVADEAGKSISIYGQENDNATRALAVMNMWLHGNPVAEIVQGNTLSSPQYTNDSTGEIKQLDYAVANPPFSYKAWMNGWDPANDICKRFEGYDSLPPKKNGDFAFLLHLIKSLKSKGKGCIVMPLGVLFRGNTEADIRKKIIQRGYIKGIIGLPPNLFYGTGIAACLIVIDKEDAEKRKDIFMIDAGKGFIKDGNKNRLQEQDIHKIVDTFNNRIEIHKYSRIISISEIEDSKNDYNLNIPRYIDSQEAEDLQDIEAHLLGDIPNRDIDDLGKYWKVYPTLKSTLFKPSKRANYSVLCIAKEEIKNTIFHHPEFTTFSKQMDAVFDKWKSETTTYAKALDKGLRPKQEIHKISENLLKAYENKKLIDKYDVYQHLMDYWAETMQDDMYELAADGWKAGNEVKRIEKKTKKGGKAEKHGRASVLKQVAGIEGLEGRLIPPALIIQEYFTSEQKAIDDLQAQIETLNAKMDEMREEHGGEDGLLGNAIDDKQKISKKNLQSAIKELGKRNDDNADEYDKLQAYKKLMEEEAKIKAEIKKALADLEILIIKKYPTLSIVEIKTIVVDKKWMHSIEQRIKTELDNISYRLTKRIKELAERYETPLPQLSYEANKLTTEVENHLKQMGTGMVKGFKNTDFGIIPEDWSVKSIKELLDDNSIISHLDGNHGELYPRSHEFTKYGVPYIGANDFAQGNVSFENCKYLSDNRARLFKKGVAKNGDVLFAHNATVGPVALLKTNLEFVILSTTATYFRCHPDKISNIFLLYFLQSKFFVKQYKSVMLQSTRFQVPITAQRKFSIFLPTLAEQTAIATALNDDDVLISSLEKLIAKKRNIKQGAMQELLKPKEGWEFKTLGVVADFSNGKAHEQFIDENGKYIVVNSKFISTEGGVVKYSNQQICPLFKGDITIVMSDIPNGKALAKCFLIDKDNKYTLNQRIGSIRPKNGESKYYCYQLNRNKYFLAFNSGTGQTNLRRDEIVDCPIPLPPTLNEQTKITKILSDMDTEIEALEKKLDKYKKNKTGHDAEFINWENKTGMMEKFKNKYRIPSARAPWWNYANNGFYFITICTAGREYLFGYIQNNEMVLSEIGNIAQQEWEKSFEIRTELFCDTFIIMPNHVHGIVQIDKNEPVETHGCASLQSQSKNHGIAYRPSKSISSFIAGFKSSATKRINEYRNTPKLPVWQSRFHDHIIRNQEEYIRIKQYIETNPGNWENDKFFIRGNNG